jgi:hypothetical protein
MEDIDAAFTTPANRNLDGDDQGGTRPDSKARPPQPQQERVSK